MQNESNNHITSTEEFTFKQLFQRRKEDFKFLWNKRKQIFFAAIIGSLLGIFAAWINTITYSSRITFVVEDTKAGGGGLTSLAGQLGFDLSSLTGSSSILAGDNVLELLISKKLIKKTLLSPFNPEKDSLYTLADRYADVYNYKNKWMKLKNNKGTSISFPPNVQSYNRLQDSLLQVIMKNIGEKEISVIKPDKKLSFFALNTTMRSEKLTELFSTRLMNEASDFYIQTKTQRLRANVDRLQHRADSIEKLLNIKTHSASASTQSLLDVNPAYTSAGVKSEVEERDKRVLQTIYSEIIKNLEVSRTMLIQETPTFQIIDEAYLPLKKNKLKYPYAIMVGIFISVLLYSLLLIILRK